MAKTTAKKTTTKEAKETTDSDLVLVGDNGAIASPEPFRYTGEYLKTDSTKAVKLLAKYNQCSEAEAAAEIIEAFTQANYGKRNSFTQLVVEKIDIQMGYENTRIDDEFRAEVKRISDEKAEERRKLELVTKQVSASFVNW